MQIKQSSCFKQEEAISTLSSKPLKLVDQFTYLGSNISSTESDVNIHAIDWLLIIWKSDISDKIKQNFFQPEAVLVLQYGCTTWTLVKKLDGNYLKHYMLF